jgi:flagellar biosynthesis regulator FlaF
MGAPVMTERYDPRNASFWDEDETPTNRQRANNLLDRAEKLLDSAAMTAEGRRNQIEAANSMIRIAQVLLGVRCPL